MYIFPNTWIEHETHMIQSVNSSLRKCIDWRPSGLDKVQMCTSWNWKYKICVFHEIVSLIDSVKFEFRIKSSISVLPMEANARLGIYGYAGNEERIFALCPSEAINSEFRLNLNFSALFSKSWVKTDSKSSHSYADALYGSSVLPKLFVWNKEHCMLKLVFHVLRWSLHE